MSEMIILWNSAGRNAAFGEKPEWSDWDDEAYDEEDIEVSKADYEKFWEAYELVTNDALGDPNEDFYQGQIQTTVYRRKSDGALFAYEWWQGGGKHGEAWIEPNGDDFGIQWDDPRGHAYVFLPAVEFTITGYAVVKPE